MTEEILLSGQQGGRYKIISTNPIDHGSTSQLFLGEQVVPEDKAGRKVAVKVGLSSDEKLSFEKEAEVLSLLWDIVPGAVPELYDSNLETKRPYLIMEYLASVRSLADLVQDRSEEHVSEKEAVYWATRYAEVLGALHDVDYTAPDRKLGDLLLVQQTTSTGDDHDSLTHKSEDDWRLVVVDWGGVASLTPSLVQFDLLLFTQFWYRLMLGGHSLPDISLGTRSPEHHRRWPELSYGARQILSRGLSRVTQRRYGEITELLRDWRELEAFWNQSPEGLEQAFKRAKGDKAYEKALKCLDIIRLVDPPRWRTHESEIDPLLNEVDTANVLVKQIKEAIRRGESLADTNVREPLARGAQQYGDDPEWQLGAHRWRILAEFSGTLSPEAHKVFREGVVELWIEAIEAMEEEKWEEARDLFWQPLNRLLSPNRENPHIEARINHARELLRIGKRIEAQERINAIVEEFCSSSPPPIDLLNNAFFPKYSRLGGILSLLVETELRNHMLNLVTNLSLGRKEEVYASSNAVRMLQGQLSYAPLLEKAGGSWLGEWRKSFDQQLNLCEKADEVLAGAAQLSDGGKFREAKWALEAIDRQFDFSPPLEPDSAQTLISEANSIARKKRYQLKAELKRVRDLIQADQLLEQRANSDDLSQVLATLEVTKGVLDNTYLKQRAAKMIDQVNHFLRSGPALISLKTTLEEKQSSTAGGDTA